jgi:hypothetical protein
LRRTSCRSIDDGVENDDRLSLANGATVTFLEGAIANFHAESLRQSEFA